MRLLSCHSGEKEDHSLSHSHSYSNRRRYFYSSSASSSSSSLSSQRSLQSVPSLSASTSHHLLDHPQRPPPSTTAVHHQCISTLKGHASHVFSLIISGKHLYSGSYNDEIRVWPRNNLIPQPPNPVATTKGAAVKSLVVLGDKLFSAHQDHKIRVRRHKSCTWVHHVDTVSALALSQDGAHLYSASWDRTFKVWRTKDFRCVESVAGAHDDAINAIVLSEDGHVYTGSADRTIKVWKKKEGERKHSLVSTLEKHRSAVNALALTIDGNVLYSGACDRSIIVWERNHSQFNGGEGEHMVVAGALRGHTKAILCLAVVDDLLISGSADKTIRIWRRSSSSSSGVDDKRSSYECLAVLEGHLKPVKCLAVAVDPNSSGSGWGKGRSYLVYSGSLDCDIKVWRVWIPCL